VDKSSKLKVWINRLASRKIKKLIDCFKPDAVICTQAFPLGIMAEYKKNHYTNFSLTGVLTDFAPHSYWVYENADTYIVPANLSKERLVEKGVRPERIHVCGIPIDPKFNISFDKNELCDNFDLKPEIPIVLIMGGGHGLGPLNNVLNKLDNFKVSLQMIVVCGLNNNLFKSIRKKDFKNKILIFKFTDQIHKLMSLADVIISKPGGITTAEALSKKLPMVILNPIPGQEARNTEILTKSGVAMAVASFDEIPSAVEKILVYKKAGDQQARFLTGLSSLAKPQASLDIAKLILRK
jgi:processive 1,2-diacylglycerol beta-glucosyltransferase